MKKYLFLCLFSVVCLVPFSWSQESAERQKISLAGIWRFQLDSLDQGESERWYEKEFDDFVNLPGTTDTNRKGILNTNYNETSYLSREYYYKGKAWYQKIVDIPESWDRKSIFLTLERTKPTKVWINEKFVGSSDDISTPQWYDLSAYLTPGIQRITVMVDNGDSVPPQLLENSHAYTESTQTNWNGIVGEISLEARPLCHIEDIQVYPDRANRLVRVEIRLNQSGEFVQQIKAELQTFNTSQKVKVSHSQKYEGNDQVIHMNISLGDKMVEWSEFDPALYRIGITIEGEGISDRLETTFGIRDFGVKGTQFTINGLTTFLRGKHDACVFPLTGHVAMDVESWRSYFKTAREYGINHYRFHSWCPPKACFEAADLEGIYLQPELPFWGTLTSKDNRLVDFLTKEGILIQQVYSNYPSFVMFAIGNELSGEQEVMVEMIRKFRETDSRHLYATGSNNCLGYCGYLEGDDYFTTCRVPGENVFENHTRGSFSFADAEEGGILNHTYPNSIMDFENAVKRSEVPIISHESGQFQIYPDYNEIKKYVGVLKPRNFEVFKKRLEEAGMADQAHDFFLASGKWSVALYRADIEMGIRTPGFGGFQLLDLQDYPGQGSAFVGILDAFMESKGLINPEEWRIFCSELVPLFRTARFCYSSDELFTGTIDIANYSSSAIQNKILTWTLTNSRNEVMDQGRVDVNIPQGALTTIGEIRPDISSVQIADKLILSLQLEGLPLPNQYEIWVYPAQNTVTIPEGIKVVRRLEEELFTALREGNKVLWFPEHSLYEDVTVGGLFQTDYWNYRMFKSICEWVGKPVSPGTLGLLMEPSHPLFTDFPTDFHTNWQWYAMVKNSRPLIMDRLPVGYKPIVQIIDNIERNHKLGLIFEVKVGEGSLLVCMADLETIHDKAEARQLYTSILHYMESVSFNPSLELSEKELSELFSMPVGETKIRELGNISYE